MKIGVDARLLSRPMTGIGRYTHEMCKMLAAMPGVSLHLYSPSPLLYAVEQAHAVCAAHPFWRSPLGRQLWAQTALPCAVRADKLDVFWGPAHRLPPDLPKNLPRVLTIHDLVWKYAADTMPAARRWLEQVEMPKSIRRADMVVADSLATAASLKEIFPNTSARIKVIYPGTSAFPIPSARAVLESLGIDRPYFLFVGTLEPRKNLDRLLQAYAALPAALREKMACVIAGGKGWGGVRIEDRIAALHLTGHVHTVGYIDEPTLATLYAHAQFLAMPSLYEGFGFPIVEANSLGTPALAANRSSMPELIGEAGILVDPHQVDSIRDGLHRLIADEAFRGQLVARAQPNAARFTWAHAAQQLMDVFQAAIRSAAC